MRILFLSHTYPPTLGGVEKQNYDLAEALKKIATVKVIANTKGKIWLPFFLPWTFLKAFFLMANYDCCLLGNGVLAPLGVILKFFHPKKKFFCVIHGLDINFSAKKTWLAKIYKNINLPSLKKMDKLFAVSNATITEAEKFGIDKELCIFIPNGVNPEEFRETHTRQELSELFGKNLKDKKVLLRLGRFVPHKGTSWFIREVMPLLPEEFVLIAAGGRVGKNSAGNTDDFLNCEQAIIDCQLKNRVRLLPSIPFQQVKILYNTVDLVVSPNIKQLGTMEGFGLNAIEAGAVGRIVLASNLEGLADAVQNGKNGILVEPEKAEVWAKKIRAIFDQDAIFRSSFEQRIAEYVKENFSWSKIARRYLEEMQKTKIRKLTKKR